MRRGPKPKPTWRRRLDGNPGKRRYNRNEPAPPAPPPEPAPGGDPFDVPPPEVAQLPRAAAEWARLAPMLRRGRQVTEADRSALVALCLEWARYLEAVDRASKAGLIVLSPNGYPMPNPFIAIATKALASCRALWPELGLTPSSRSRVEVPPGEEDPFAEFDHPPPLNPDPTTTH